MAAPWTMWKTCPQRLWRNEWLAASCVDNVENLSTGIVEKSPLRRCYVDGVENLSTGIVENSLMDDSSVENLSTRIVENVKGGSFLVK
jgi:hypothetical protein